MYKLLKILIIINKIFIKEYIIAFLIIGNSH